jgi:anaerobic ribonucleoside-triphosphate reductase
MPRIAHLAKSKKDFMQRLEKLMELSKESLETKRKVLEKFTDSNLYPYTKYYLRNVKERFNEYWKNHFSTIGLVGMNEACLNLLNVNIASEKGQAFTKQVLDFMRKNTYQFSEGNRK